MSLRLSAVDEIVGFLGNLVTVSWASGYLLEVLFAGAFFYGEAHVCGRAVVCFLKDLVDKLIR
jgi:hypothetical protein